MRVPDEARRIILASTANTKNIQKACRRAGHRVTQAQIRHVKSGAVYVPSAYDAAVEAIERALSLGFPPGYVSEPAKVDKRVAHLRAVATMNREQGRA